MRTFKIYTLGCKVNKYDSGRLATYLESYGLSAVKTGADLIVVNTCSVTQSTGTKNSRMIALARLENPGAKLVVCGCWTRIYPEDKRNFSEALVISDKNPETVAELIAGEFKLEENDGYSHDGLIKQERARYTIKIQDGCRQFCTYCIIPYARGVLWSREAKEILAEAKKAIASGYQEIILTGIHLGLYGYSSDGRMTGELNLTGLLKKLLALDGAVQYRLSSIEVTEVTPELIELFKLESRLCQHLHISLQSGSDKILKLMNRPYTSEEFLKTVKQLRAVKPQIAITTDVIVGFPGETENDYLVTEKFIKTVGFSKVHVFPFSAHPKAPAAALPKQLALEVIKDRARRLRQLTVKLEKEYRAKFSGQELEHLVIGKRHGQYICKTEYFFDSYVPAEELEKKYGQNLVGKKIKLVV